MRKSVIGGVLVVAGLILASHAFFASHSKNSEPVAKNDIRSNAVMITNRAMNHGGTGLIWKSFTSKSWVLTNAHVCKVVVDGGMVLSDKGNYQVHSVIESKYSDLCLLSVLDDLKLNTTVSTTPPQRYDEISVSGFPALMPNIVSKGHLSSRAVIPVFIGTEPCTEKDDPIMCMFLGGKPIIKFYESVLTSATIMPGNSGSGVYNSNDELIGLVFAGQGNLGYSWTVPYEQVVQFLRGEALKTEEVLTDHFLHADAKQQEKRETISELIVKCQNERPTDPRLLEVCSLISRDMIWRK